MGQIQCREPGQIVRHGYYLYLDVWELQANRIFQRTLSEPAELSSFPTVIRIMARRYRGNLNEVA